MAESPESKAQVYLAGIQVRAEAVRHCKTTNDGASAIQTGHDLRCSGVRKRITSKSPVRENRTPGSVRGASGNWRPYRDVHDIGSIAVGKKAYLVLFDTRRPEWRTLFNPTNSLVYNADGRSVHTVIVEDRVVVEDHTPCYVDEWELMRKVQTLGERLLARTGIHFAPRWPVV